MPAPTTNEEFLDLARKSGVVDEKRLEMHLQKLRDSNNLPPEPGKLAGILVRDGILTHFQAEQFLLGKWRRFTIGKYKVLEKLGHGGMGSVYLCEHKFMRRRAAVKVLPAQKAADPSSLERFYREARAVAALDHPNIVRAYDIDQDDQLHFLVMEYVDGSSLQEIIKRFGPMNIQRACHYVRQAAMGLEHAHQAAGVVHRDIKPGNILVDRTGVVKILDMGLARFFHDTEDNLTNRYDENVLGTADYLAPEQALDSHNVDIRADIYSLGSTFYFLLTGNPPFKEGTTAQKLIWHQTRTPTPVRSSRPDVPEGVAAVLDRMMAKERSKRFQKPAEVAEALVPFTLQPIPPPSAQEMPHLSPAALPTGSMADMSLSLSGSGGNVAAKAGSGFVPLPPAAAVSQEPAPEWGPLPTRPSAPAATFGQAVLTQAEEESSVPWETLTPATDNLTAQTDTPPSSQRSLAPTALAKQRTLMIVLAFVLVFAAFLIVWLVLNQMSEKPATSKSSSTGAVLTVTQGRAPHGFRTVRAALEEARNGDKIVVHDEVIEESLFLEGGRRKGDLTIEAAEGKNVLWACPEKPRDGKFIFLDNMEKIRLKGFTFDGRSRADDLVTLVGQCPGIVLQDLVLRGFKRHGLVVMNCTGGNDEGIIALKNVRVVSSGGAESGIVFKANPYVIPPINQNLLVSDCRFEGPFHAAIQVTGPVLDVEFRRNRIFNAEQGFLYKKAEKKEVPPFPLRIDFKSNTLCQLTQAAFHFENLPSADKKPQESRVRLEDNLFAKTGALVQVDQVEGGQAVYPTAKGNVRDTFSKEGSFSLAATVVTFDLPTDPSEPAHFLRYPKNSPLAQAGSHRGPVGFAPE